MDEDATCVNISYLISQGYIDGDEVKDPETKENMNGSVRITKNSNKYTYEYKENKCMTIAAATASTKTTGNVPTGNYAEGDEYIINIEGIEGRDKHFFVLGVDDSSKVDLIMSENLEGYVVWINNDDFITAGGLHTDWDASIRNTKGPIRANVHLASKTSNWEVTPHLPTYDQLYNAGCRDTYRSCPEWLYINLYNNIGSNIGKQHAFWTGTSRDVDGTRQSAWMVNYEDKLGSTKVYSDTLFYGVRPVITIPKSKLDLALKSS